MLPAPCILVQGSSTSQRENATMGEESSCQMREKHECLLELLEGFGYKSSLMNWKPEILKMELRDKEQV